MHNSLAPDPVDVRGVLGHTREARTLVVPDARLPSIAGKDWRPGEALHLWENITDRSTAIDAES